MTKGLGPDRAVSLHDPKTSHLSTQRGAAGNRALVSIDRCSAVAGFVHRVWRRLFANLTSVFGWNVSLFVKADVTLLRMLCRE